MNSLSFQIATPPQKIGGSAAAQSSPGAEHIRSAATRHLAICRTRVHPDEEGAGSRRCIRPVRLFEPLYYLP